jgi:uncharacterized protein
MKHFEWDENKRHSNIEKHRLDFVDAITVFKDNDALEVSSMRDDEVRFKTIGKIENTEFIIVVVWTRRQKNTRVISARIAKLNERRLYNEKQNKMG